MIEEVQLENFISHKHTSLKLGSGISVFVGQNGAGKSSVIDGVTFALYGKHMRGDENRNLVMRGSSQAAVSVQLRIAGKIYLAERKIDSRGRLLSAVLKEIDNGSIRQIAAGERRQMEESMAEEIRKITGLSFDMMKIATIVQQGELDKIITEYKPSEMKNLINEVIGIERLDRAYQSMKDSLIDFKSRLRAKYENYDTDSIDDIVAKIEGDQIEIKQKTASLTELENELAEIQIEQNQLSEKIRVLEDMKRKAENAERFAENLRKYVNDQRSKMNEEEKELARKIPKAKESLQLMTQKEGVEIELNQLTKDEDELNEGLRQLDVKIAELKAVDLQKLERDVVQARNRLNRTKEELTTLSVKIEQLKQISKPGERKELELKRDEFSRKEESIRDELGGIRDKINDYTTLMEKGVCPVCDTVVTPENIEMKLTSKMNEKDRKEKELITIEEELKNVQQLLSALQEYESAQKMLEEYTGQFNNVSKEKEEIEQEIREKEDELQEAKKKIDDLGQFEKEREVAYTRLNMLRARKQELQKVQNKIIAAESFLNENKISGEEDIAIMHKRREELLQKLKSIPDDIQKADILSLKIDDFASGLAEQIINLLDEAKGYDEDSYVAAKMKHDQEVMPKLQNLREQRGALRDNIEKLREEVERLSKAKDELELARRYVNIYEKIRNEIYNRDGILATSVRSWALRQISKKASEYVREFGIGISQIEFREGKREINIICYGEGGEVPVSSMSGGEKVAIALALRFAIADLIGKGSVDFIVFDEPTTHLDEERRRSLVRLISDIVSREGNSMLNQIIIITHDEEIFENSEVAMIYKFDKTSEGTKVTSLGG
ncbi:MAG: SMC family ATPase [Conexivisphaerales archaeon]